MHIYVQGNTARHKKSIHAICSDIDAQLEIIVLNEIIKRMVKHHSYHLCVESKFGTNEPIYKTETDLAESIQNRPWEATKGKMMTERDRTDWRVWSW